MKKYTIALLALIVVAILAYSYNLISYLLLLFVALSLAVLLIAGAIKVFRKSMSRRWFEIACMVMVISVIGVMVGLLRPLEPPIIGSGNVSKALAYAYKTDQQDRMTLKFGLGMFGWGKFRNQMQLRDSIRLDQVKKLYKSQPIPKPLDQFHAAFIFHHSHKSKLFEIAHKLAAKAAAAEQLKDTYQVQWLAKATYDRWMLSVGKQQKYGTQGTFSLSVK